MRKTVPEQARGDDEHSADERRGERHGARSRPLREAHIRDGDGAEGRQRRGAGVDRRDQRFQLVARAQPPSGENGDAENGQGRKADERWGVLRPGPERGEQEVERRQFDPGRPMFDDHPAGGGVESVGGCAGERP